MAGLLGLIYGPVILILFVTTIQIYREHFSHHDDEEQIAETEGESGTESAGELAVANQEAGEEIGESGDAS